eukprot:5491149-Prymnesium_polylepis.1
MPAQERDSHQVNQSDTRTACRRLSGPAPHEKPVRNCPQPGSPMPSLPHRVPCTLSKRVTHVGDSRRVRQPQTRSQRPAALSATAQCCHHRAECPAGSARA